MARIIGVGGRGEKNVFAKASALEELSSAVTS